MRDKNRLDGFYDTIKDIHKESFCDWRFLQLMFNFMEWIVCEKKREPFYIEENEALELFKEYKNRAVVHSEQGNK